ncbi:MAG: outer membrane beta-barrel protein [Hyphomicrobium sp.]|jgi:opacity protein-like surface antigen
MIKLIFTATVAALIIGGQSVAHAQDSSRANWGGLYGGGHVGYGFGFPTTAIEASEFERVWDLNPDVPPPAAFPAANSGLQAQDGEFDGTVATDLTGVVGGIHIGYNFQVSNIVFGVEGAYNWGRLSNTVSQAIPEPEVEVNPAASAASQARSQAIIDALNAGTTAFEGDPEFDLKSSLGDIKSVKGRIGIASGNFLLYGVGGVAWTNYRASVTSPDSFSGGLTSGTFSWGENVNGWVAGGGIEFKLTNNLSLRAEALHYDFGQVGFGGEDINVDNIQTFLGSQDLSINELTVGASYHFN